MVKNLKYEIVYKKESGIDYKHLIIQNRNRVKTKLAIIINSINKKSKSSCAMLNYR